MNRVHFEVRSEDLAEPERFSEERDARAFVARYGWSSVELVRVTVEPLSLEPKRKAVKRHAPNARCSLTWRSSCGSSRETGPVFRVW